MTSVVGMATEDGESDDRDPFSGERIEVPEEEMRTLAAPQILLGKVKRRLDTLATRVTYGR